MLRIVLRNLLKNQQLLKYDEVRFMTKVLNNFWHLKIAPNYLFWDLFPEELFAFSDPDPT